MFLFYLGHIPAFADIHLSAHFKEPLTEPVDFARLFERGEFCFTLNGSDLTEFGE